MSISLWVLYVIFAFILGAFCATIVMIKQGKSGYGEGYSEGYKNGANEKFNEVYNVRLLRQARRLTREEKKNEPVNPETGHGELQGVAEPSDSEPGSSESGLFEHDADPRAGEETIL